MLDIHSLSLHHLASLWNIFAALKNPSSLNPNFDGGKTIIFRPFDRQSKNHMSPEQCGTLWVEVKHPLRQMSFT